MENSSLSPYNVGTIATQGSRSANELLQTPHSMCVKHSMFPAWKRHWSLLICLRIKGCMTSYTVSRYCTTVRHQEQLCCSRLATEQDLR
jgi:hypothetical protein